MIIVKGKRKRKVTSEAISETEQNEGEKNIMEYIAQLEKKMGKKRENKNEEEIEIEKQERWASGKCGLGRWSRQYPEGGRPLRALHLLHTPPTPLACVCTAPLPATLFYLCFLLPVFLVPSFVTQGRNGW